MQLRREVEGCGLAVHQIQKPLTAFQQSSNCRTAKGERQRLEKKSYTTLTQLAGK
jgi:hypothetical protein